MRSFLMDVRYAVRTLLKSPAFTAVAVLSLALGIAVNSAVFSVVSAMLFGSTPYPEPDRLVLAWETVKAPAGAGLIRRSPAVANVLDWAARGKSFEGIGVAEGFIDTVPMVAAGPAEAVRPQPISANLLPVLHVQPVLGRNFLEGEEAILLSYPFWQRRFGGDPKVLGRSLLIGGRAATVTGIMPPRFLVLHGNEVDIWSNANVQSPHYQTRKEHWFSAIGRLGPGVTMERAQAELDGIAAGLAAAYPDTNRNAGVRLVNLHEYLTGGMRQAALILLGAVGFVLLIACANVANLMLARLTVRAGEMSVRASLGATSTRLIRQMLTESLVLATLGGALGLLLAGWALDLLVLAVPRAVAGLYATSLDPRVLVYTVAATALTALLFGMAPSWQLSRSGVFSRGTAGRSTHRLRGAMVVCEVALSIVLLAGTGLMIRTLLGIGAVDPGFDPHHVITGMTHLAGPKFVSTTGDGRDMKRISPAADLFYTRLQERVSALPGVQAVAFTSDLPDTGVQRRTFTIAGRPAPPDNERPATDYYEVSPSFFATMRVPLRAGRVFDESDRAGSPWTAVVDEAFAKRYFPGVSPVGQYIRFRFEPYKVEEDQPRRIVGVVATIKFDRREEADAPVAYASNLQQPALFPGGRTSAHLRRRLLIRTRADVIPAVRSIVSDLDRGTPLNEVKTMDFILEETELWTIYLARLLGIFAALAAVLAATGIYGVMSYTVTERTREIGIRTALGAERAGVLRFILRKTLALTAIGALCGVSAAMLLTRLISGVLFGVTSFDPPTYAAVIVLLGAVALAAGYFPARRAARLDPMAALRYE